LDKKLMKKKEKEFIDVLSNRPLVVWGARMTGMGLLRFSKKHNLNIVGFVDGDPSLTGKMIGDFKIDTPDKIKTLKAKYNNLSVVVAVALKEDEIINELDTMGVSKKDRVNYSEYCDCFFTIDIVGNCSLKCPSCAQSIVGIKNPMGIMKLDDFKKVIKKMKEQVDVITHVSLYSWGEPLLHKELHLIVEHLHEQGIAAAVSSHLSIPSDDQIRKLVKSSPEYLKVSTSGFYPDAYNSTHTGGDVNLVKANMYKIKYYMDAYKSKIYVDVNYHLYKNNIGKDLEMMKNLCDELGFGLSTTYPVVFPIERCIDYLEGRPSKEVKELSKLLLVNIDEGLEITKSQRDQPCRYLTNQVNINWDRSVPLCCVTFDRQKNSSIISNDFLKDSVKNLEKKKENHSLCTKCIGHGIPPYQLGVNLKGWEKKAKDNSDLAAKNKK
tara:strand:- start:769 stop:2079 length:1311 start_codon:yes stop_codon:yes gene_type:complete